MANKSRLAGFDCGIVAPEKTTASDPDFPLEHCRHQQTAVESSIMSTWHSTLLGIRTSGDYFLSTFMFGVMFGIAAAASGIEDWHRFGSIRRTRILAGAFTAGHDCAIGIPGEHTQPAARYGDDAPLRRP
jgi:hypothetical protein